jgi:hypothetical protein
MCCHFVFKHVLLVVALDVKVLVLDLIVSGGLLNINLFERFMDCFQL